MKMDAEEIIVDLIKQRIAFMNLVRTSANADAMERLRDELMGMMVCLKNVSTYEQFNCRFYSVNYFEDNYEFGYYGNDGKWFSLEA